MSEEADNTTSTTTPVPTATPSSPTVAASPVQRSRHGRVTQAAAWVGIVAGVTFVVAVIFFSGFILGKQSGGGGHHRGGPDREMGMMHRGGPPMGPPHFVFGPGAQGGPGGQGAQQGQGPGPGNAPTTAPRP